MCAIEVGGSRKDLCTWEADAVLPSASAAKVLVLLEAARAVSGGGATLAEPLSRTNVAPVADSGLWQHLATDTLPLGDVARLVGAVSDNWATNVLLRRLGGIEQIAATAEGLDIRDVFLHDILRDVRNPVDPVTLSTGTARGYAELFARLASADGIDADVTAQVCDWLGDGVDLSMVVGAFGLDPLAHTLADRGFRVINKTGTDAGVRVDVGFVEGPSRTVAYACLAGWDERLDPSLRDDVLAEMRAFGMLLRELTA
ncbi:hypothetical protein ASD65_15615 [Microbacterium sp. Root61]|nr:hypothetical protein ASD65_15615 [Microbacterium sp. Root61]